jgi:hypothetical protein
MRYAICGVRCAVPVGVGGSGEVVRRADGWMDGWTMPRTRTDG